MVMIMMLRRVLPEGRNMRRRQIMRVRAEDGTDSFGHIGLFKRLEGARWVAVVVW